MLNENNSSYSLFFINCVYALSCNESSVSYNLLLQAILAYFKNCLCFVLKIQDLAVIGKALSELTVLKGLNILLYLCVYIRSHLKHTCSCPGILWLLYLFSVPAGCVYARKLKGSQTSLRSLSEWCVTACILCVNALCLSPPCQGGGGLGTNYLAWAQIGEVSIPQPLVRAHLHASARPECLMASFTWLWVL